MGLGNLCFILLSAMLIANVILADELDETNKRWWGEISFNRLSNITRSRRAPKLGFMPSVSGCDVTKEPGWTCANCSTLKLCNTNNVSVTFNCGIFMPYCVNGECSMYPSEACNSSEDNESSN
ncbi:unnamed protein product [Leptosia nina]|uniref:Uncharacterized protein n=1 Tax=Leptosia nina TaxID=320188 RepID=A0AAV1K2S1_9NEOP